MATEVRRAARTSQKISIRILTGPGKPVHDAKLCGVCRLATRISPSWNVAYGILSRRFSRRNLGENNGNLKPLIPLSARSRHATTTGKQLMNRFTLGARCLLFAATAIFLTAISPGRAATIAWTNIAGGNWNDATNWTPNQVPGAADNALITSNGTYIVTLDV